MKYFVAVAAAVASVAVAQLENLPSCATACFLTPLTSDGCAALDDFKCHCEKSDTLFASVIPCVKKACPVEAQQETITAVEGLCAENGVPITVPDTPGASSSVEAAPSSSAEPSSSEAAPTSVVESTQAPSIVPTSSEESSSAAVTSSATVSGTPSASGNGTAPTSSTPPPFTGAAAMATQAAGLLGAAAIAIFAL